MFVNLKPIEIDVHSYMQNVHYSNTLFLTFRSAPKKKVGTTKLIQGSHQGVEADRKNYLSSIKTIDLAPDKEMEILSLELVPSGTIRISDACCLCVGLRWFLE